MELVPDLALCRAVMGGARLAHVTLPNWARQLLPVAGELWTRRPRLIGVVGMGARGSALGVAGQVRRFPPVPDDRPVVDTNGAGDGLAVGFLTCYALERRPLEESVWRCQLAARHTCSLRGRREGLITAAELEERFLDSRRG